VEFVSQPLLVDISPLASGDKSNGHWYWFHKKISEIENSITFARIQSGVEFGVNKLEGRYDYENVPKNSIQRDFRRIKKVLSKESSSIIFHIYEGNYQSIFLACRLLAHFKNSIAIVNLHWADQVASDLDVNHESMRNFRSALREVLEKFKSRLHLQVESEKLASFMSKTLDYEVEPYLVCSVYDIPNKNMDKTYTALISPSGESEFFSAIEGTKALIENGHRIAINISKYLYPSIISDSHIDEARTLGYEIFVSNLDENQYVSLGSSSKIALLTYRSDFYRWGSSGRLLDAVRFGSRIVLPEGTAVADQVLQNGWGTAYGENSNLDIRTAINLELQKTMSSISSKNAPGVEDLRDYIFGLYASHVNSSKEHSSQAWVERVRTHETLRRYLVSSYKIRRSNKEYWVLHNRGKL
jgi:hypothetical protein